MRTEGFDGHVGEWRDGIKGQGNGTDFAESGEFDGQIGVFGEFEDFFEGVIRGLLAFADAREVFDHNGQVWKCPDYFCKFIAQKTLGTARRADDEVEFGCRAPLREGIGAIGAAICWQANAHDALFCPLSHGRAVVCWVNDHGRLKFSRMCRHAVEHVLVIRVSRVLDEDGAIDAGCVHVVEQGILWVRICEVLCGSVYRQWSLRFTPEGNGVKTMRPVRAVARVLDSRGCHSSGY